MEQETRKKAALNEIEIKCVGDGNWYASRYEENGDVVTAGPCKSVADAVMKLLRT